MPKVRDSGMPPQGLWESFFDPAAILDALGAERIDGDAVEFGSGYGTFTIPAARRASGTVYALEIDPEMAVATRACARSAGLANVEVLERDFVSHGTGRPPGSVDYVLLFNILHFEDPAALLAETHRILKDGGRAGVMHWKRDPATPRGPALEIRPAPEDCVRWAAQAGLHATSPRALPRTPWHWGLTLERRTIGTL
jgi:SAM-dependent methyltransferase